MLFKDLLLLTIKMKLFSEFINLKDEVNAVDNYYYFEHGFTDDDLTKVESLLEKYSKKLQDGVVGSQIDKTYRDSKISWIPLNDETKWLYNHIGGLVNKANNKLWSFDIVGMGEEIQYTEYHDSVKGHYDWHMDVGERLPFRKISVTIQLSEADDYEGGELQFMTGNTVRNAPKGRGVTILFPSFVLHKVTPVTKGTRRSLVIWVSGPPFR